MHELDTQGEWQRLYERYHAMSDDELLDLAAGIDDLTEIAADVLRRELKNRRLEIAQPVGMPAGIVPPLRWWNPGQDEAKNDSEIRPEAVTLRLFYDAIEAGRACEFLEEQQVKFEMKDVSPPRSGMGGPYSPPAVALKLIVDRQDRERAMAILREKMGLFPLQEVAVADELVDDGSVGTAGMFARREDAEQVLRVLDDAHIWHRLVANPEGTVEDEDCYTLEVREVDLMRAGELVERAMNLREG
jgi:hypothetical protein